MQLENDTIVAISTPPGRGGIGIVRLSGPDALRIAEPLCRLRHPMAAGQARFGAIVDPESGAVLDEAVVTSFAAPRSYTSEDVVEMAVHGAPVLLDALLRACLRGGARLAEPGEFTQRAFLSGRLDLAQAEAVHDLIAAQTLQQARVAAAQLGGSLAQTLAPVKQQLVTLIASLEAGVDFAEDDIDLLPQAEIATSIERIRSPLQRLAATYAYGRVVRNGFTLAIVGRPNVGKSSLFNRLLERERAIVTAQPGTTRDPIAEQLSLNGIPVQLVDTAGLRAEPEGEAEREGIARSRTAMAEADFILQVVDGSEAGAGTFAPESLDAEDRATLAAIAGRPHLVVINKLDLMPSPPPQTLGFASPPVFTSTLTGAGVEELKQQILGSLVETVPAADSAMITNLRQQQTLQETLAALAQAGEAATHSLPHELLLLDLYAVLTAMGSLTGASTPDDILNLIFRNFCIGK